MRRIAISACFRLFHPIYASFRQENSMSTFASESISGLREDARLAREAAESAAVEASLASQEAASAAEQARLAQAEAALATEKAERVYVRSLSK
jgi:hypothetical protein